MQLERVVLRDVGTYKGELTFDLIPRTRYNARRPVVLFGGLNGAGKTTFLSAVRLCLYGRQALDTAPTQKEYAEHLLGLIHRSRGGAEQANGASIGLTFVHSRLGRPTRYCLERAWQKRGSKVEEVLTLSKGGEQLPFLSDDQAQAFISALIPPGVSTFFFFDGERISALARDDDDLVLADAIRRLMGLDVADRLDADLATFVRNRRISSGATLPADDLAQVQKDYEQSIHAADSLQRELVSDIQMQLDSAIARREQLRAQLADRGGAWAINRTAVEEHLRDLAKRRLETEERVRELLAGAAMFTLAPKLSRAVAEAVEREQNVLDYERSASIIQSRVGELKAAIKAMRGSEGWRSVANRCIDEWSKELRPKDRKQIVHGLSGSEATKILDVLGSKVAALHSELIEQRRLLSRIGEEEAQEQDRLRHAPPDNVLQSALAELEAASEQVAVLQGRKQATLQEIRRLLWVSIGLVRKRRKLEQALGEDGSQDRAVRLAGAVQDLLTEYKTKAADHKCAKLRENFLATHRRLARKEDIIADVRIDPDTFKITLVDRDGAQLAKKQLSAGEKQIFAIAMLDALGKTSGRNLPVIIDTPLGRLDSKHRSKLVEQYFPTASHQVIVLSTDTEVDERFYDGLKSYISHAYHLEFDPVSGATTAHEGYFWREALRDAA